MRQLIGIFLLIILFSSNVWALTAHEKNTIKIFKSVSPSVVNIKNIKIRYNFFLDPMAVPRGTGSGFIWNKEGYIVTNYHVVEDGDVFVVTLIDQKQYEAKLVGGAPRKDIAVLKLTKKVPKLTPIKIGSSQNLDVGQTTIAIGNPFGLDRSMSSGIISALGRDIPGYGGVKIRGMIQTDAAINQGNSGGPLLNSDGKLIGMNTMIYSPTGASAGIGFAVPAQTIKAVVPQIIKHGRVIQPRIGIIPLPDEFMKQIGVQGVGIRAVERGSSAHRAKLRGVRQDVYGRLLLGDIIVGINDKRVKTFDDFFAILERHKIGDVVKVKILRKNKPLSIKMKLIAI